MAGLWYVAYGSNLSGAALQHHLDRAVTPRAAVVGPGAVREHRWLRLPHRVWFGGRSRRWAGGVAFLDPAVGSGLAHGRAWVMTPGEFEVLLRRENGRPALAWSADTLASLPLGGSHRVQVPLSPDGTLGKYDLVLRLPDLASRPAYTVTTGRALASRPPTPDYLAVIAAGLAEHPEPVDVPGYLAGLGR